VDWLSSNFYGDRVPRNNTDADLADGAGEVFVGSRMSGAVDGWSTRYIAKGIWELRPVGAYPGKLLMTAGAVTSTAKIPFAHRLVKMEWKHLDENLVDGTDATAAILSRDDYIPLGNVLWRLYYEAASVSSTTVVPFGEAYEYYGCSYVLSFNTTNGDWVIPVLWVQELKP
jgi:hypothetical protein